MGRERNEGTRIGEYGALGAGERTALVPETSPLGPGTQETPCGLAFFFS